MRWSQLNFVVTFPKFVTTQFKEKEKNFVATIKILLQQSLERNTSQKCCEKSTTKDENIEAAYMSRHS